MKSSNIINQLENNRNIGISSGKKILENGYIQKKYLNSDFCWENFEISVSLLKLIVIKNTKSSELFL